MVEEDEKLYTQLWISYYIIKENETDLVPKDVILAFSKSKETRFPELPDLEPITQLDVTEGVDKWIAYGHENYEQNELNQMIASYTVTVETVRILENVTPQHAKKMFKDLIKLNKIEGPEKGTNGLDYIDFSVAGIEEKTFYNNLLLSSIQFPNTVNRIDGAGENTTIVWQ